MNAPLPIPPPRRDGNTATTANDQKMCPLLTSVVPLGFLLHPPNAAACLQSPGSSALGKTPLRCMVEAGGIGKSRVATAA